MKQREFISLKIAVLTVSDTRTEEQIADDNRKAREEEASTFLGKVPLE